MDITADRPDVRFYDVKQAPFELYGFYQPLTEAEFRRVPDEIAAATSEGIRLLAAESAGGRVRFATDSEYIAIKVEMTAVGRNVHTPLEASAGFDIYQDYAGFGESRFIKAIQPQYTIDNGYEQVIDISRHRRLRYFTVNFPIHSCVKSLYIGLQEDALVEQGLKYRNHRPIVIYGSSIVHGTGATRPGLIYSNMLSRRLDMDVLNLGFSGNAKGEDTMIDFISSLDMSIFICDYDHNAPNPEHLQMTHRHFYDRFREIHPDVPYVMISRPNIANYKVSNPELRRDIVIDTYRYARENGDTRVWYIDGESFFLGNYENDCTIDAVHPNDLGYELMADGIECVIRRIMSECDCLN